MIKFDSYYYRDEDLPKIIIGLDWFEYEDRWRSRYMFERPKYDDEQMERLRLENLNRHSWFRIKLNLFHYHINLDFKLKHVGNVMHGRVMNDGPWSIRNKRKKDEPKKLS
jgi:hypothetical protein